MKELTVVFFMMFVANFMHAQQSIEGIWDTGKENTKIELKKVEGEYIGTIVSSDNKKAKEGTKLIKDVQSENGEWKGKLFVAKKKKWKDATFVSKGDELEITVSSGWMSKTVEWAKVN